MERDQRTRMIWAGILALCFFCGPQTLSWAQEIKVVFTGQSYAALYPCSCPVESDGGVSRRASFVKNLRAASPRVLLVDAGNSFASGPSDPNAQNYEADIRRTEVSLSALREMGYDALLAGSQEYAFGEDFLARAKEQLPFISSNMEGFSRDSVIKDLGGIKVGILGLTDDRVLSKGVSGWQSPDFVLARKVAALKQEGVDLIILLSALSFQEDQGLLRNVQGIDVVINGTLSYGSVGLSEVGGTAYVTTWWQARKIGVLTLEISGRAVVKKNLESFRLSSETPDDEVVTALLPECFSAAECKQKKGFTTTCEKASTKEARCVYVNSVPVPLTVVRPRSCRTCRSDDAIKALGVRLGDLTTRYLSEDDPEAKDLIKAFGLTMLPAYFFDKSFQQSVHYPYLASSLEKGDSFYWLKPEKAGVSYLLGRPKTPKVLDVVFGFDSSVSPAFFELLKNFQKKHKDIDVRIHLLAVPDKDKKGKFLVRDGDASELEKLSRIACVDALYPQKTFDYLICCLKEKESSWWWDECLVKSKMSVSKIKSCVFSEQGAEALGARTKLTQELKVASGPTFIMDNTEIFGFVNLPDAQEFERFVLGVQEESKK